MLDLVNVASIDCSDAGLKLQAMDTEEIVLIELFFPAEEFQKYDCDEDLSMDIPIDDIVNVIRCADKDDTITIKVRDENFDTITLSFESPQENNTKTYELRLVDASSQRILVPDWQVLDSNYQAIVQMPSVDFLYACKYIDDIGSNAYISVTEERLKFFAFGQFRYVTTKYMQRPAAVTYNMRAPVSVTLDSKYLYSIAKASTLFDQVKICLSTMHLLMVECKIGKIGYIRYFLAPKEEIEKE